jgi:hypothetical protein
MVSYRAVREMLDQGATIEQALEVIERTWLEDGPPRWDMSPFDEWEVENLYSIWRRGEQDALAGRPPCPIWGDFPSPRKRKIG